MEANQPIRRSGPRLVLPVAFVLLAAPGVPAREAPPEGIPLGEARSADAFVDSVGVCTHWGYPDTPYGFAYDQVKQRLNDSGIRHVRDGFNARIADLNRSGLRLTVLAEPDQGTPSQIRDRVKKLLPAVEAVEGTNEPDLFWKRFKKSYQGQGHAQGPEGIARGVIAFQNDLYQALKGDPATARLTVIGPALGVTYDPGGGKPNPLGKGTLSEAVDWGNFHPYPGGNPFSVPFPYGGLKKFYWQGSFPSAGMDEYPFQFKTYAPPFAPKPMAATETGYSTYAGGVSEAVQAKYVPRLFAEFYRLGVRRTFLYELVDEFEDKKGDNREAHFGLLRRDVSPKPAYAALQSLLGLLADRRAADLKPAALDARLVVRPAGDFTRTKYVHHLLLQKGDGDFYLLLWHEVSAEDPSVTPHRPLSPPPLPATLTLGRPVRRVVLYRYDETGKLDGKEVPAADGKVTVEVPDQVVVLRLTPGA